MKKLWILSVVLLGMFSCQTRGDEVEDLTLTEEEKNDLLVLREEEKLARDVYLFAGDLYDLPIFANIASSEQNHMDQVLVLLQKYELEDPVIDQRGVFRNADIQQLYNQLTTLASQSEVEALKVGATIEDLDIHDISTFESHTRKTDILEVYARLKCGSRNHLRSYYARLQDYGITYSPQYISQEEFESIVNSPHEQCGRN